MYFCIECPDAIILANLSTDIRAIGNFRDHLLVLAASARAEDGTCHSPKWRIDVARATKNPPTLAVIHHH